MSCTCVGRFLRQRRCLNVAVASNARASCTTRYAHVSIREKWGQDWVPSQVDSVRTVCQATRMRLCAPFRQELLLPRGLLEERSSSKQEECMNGAERTSQCSFQRLSTSAMKMAKFGSSHDPPPRYVLDFATGQKRNPGRDVHTERDVHGPPTVSSE